jgi:thiosulfate dehydrogenase
MKNFVLGLVLGLLILPVGVLGYFRLGSPPVATADPQLPSRSRSCACRCTVASIARSRRQCPSRLTTPRTPRVLRSTARSAWPVTGCRITRVLAKGMFPPAPQLFVRHGDHVGVSDDEPGETYWVVANGVRLSGMPAYKQVLSETALWQVTLLLAHTDKLPPGVMRQLAP